jgi:hypothetical protein
MPRVRNGAQPIRIILGTCNVRFGSLADILRCGSDVRFTSESGHVQCNSVCPLSAKSGHPPEFGKLLLSAYGIDHGKEGRRIDTVHGNWLTFGRIGICHCGSHSSLLSLIGRFRKSGHCLFRSFGCANCQGRFQRPARERFSCKIWRAFSCAISGISGEGASWR